MPTLGSNRAASSGAPGMQYTSNWPSTMQWTTSQGSAGAPLQKHMWRNRPNNNRAPVDQEDRVMALPSITT